jgi:hypothetical protein
VRLVKLLRVVVEEEVLQDLHKVHSTVAPVVAELATQTVHKE